MASELICRREGPVIHLTLNRPEKANALSAPLVEALLDALARARTDGIQLLVLAGAGTHFSAGFDFTGDERLSDGDLALRFLRIEMLLQGLYHAPFDTMVLAHGRCFGAGVDIVCACGIRIAAPGTTFRLPGLQFGLVLGTRRLSERIGADRAREILSASRTFDSAEALSAGLLTHVAPQEEWPRLIDDARRRSQALEPSAAAALHARTVSDTRDADMAALVRSVAEPGLAERIRRFRSAAAAGPALTRNDPGDDR